MTRASTRIHGQHPQAAVPPFVRASLAARGRPLEPTVRSDYRLSVNDTVQPGG